MTGKYSAQTIHESSLFDATLWEFGKTKLLFCIYHMGSCTEMDGNILDIVGLSIFAR